MDRNNRKDHAGGSLLARIVLVCSVLVGSLATASASQQITSPDGKVIVEVDDRDGRPTYQVSLDGVTVIERSPLGLKANFEDLTQGLTLKDCEVRTFSDEYWLKTWKQSHVKYDATEAVCHFEKVGGERQPNRLALDVIFRVASPAQPLPTRLATPAMISPARTAGARGIRSRASSRWPPLRPPRGLL